jgi:hypothetical protein
MQNADDVRARLNVLHEAVWELAAIALAFRDGTSVDPALRRSAERVVVENGMLCDDGNVARPTPGLAEAAGADGAMLAAQSATAILQAAAVLSGANAWTSQDDAAILAQGAASAQAVRGFKAFAVPMMAGLADLLSGPSPVMLDVGVGVAAMAAAYCQAFPTLRVVGLDVFPRALELAHETVERAGVAHRVELRSQDVATLEDRDL